ncbi:MAG: nucleotide exchange factor GrpE [Clostridia bacterium]|nr:nucleotide exchange factor GrpE [Clostridia bacterium]
MSKNKEKNKAQEPARQETPAAETEEKAEVKTETETILDETPAEDGSVTLSKEEFEQAKAEIERMRGEIEASKKNADEAVLDAQRIQAEFANFRKRNQSIRSESIDDGVRETVKALLPVLDNFDRALANSDGSPFAEGMEKINKQLIDCLKKCGMEEVEAEGAFDPNLHEAVMQDTESEAESGTITAVLQRGYRVKGKIIRHTMVKVKA